MFANCAGLRLHCRACCTKSTTLPIGFTPPPVLVDEEEEEDDDDGEVCVGCRFDAGGRPLLSVCVDEEEEVVDDDDGCTGAGAGFLGDSV